MTFKWVVKGAHGDNIMVSKKIWQKWDKDNRCEVILNAQQREQIY